MRSIAQERREGRLKRHRRIRKHLAGSAERPRLCVFRSLMHIYGQVVDDVRGATIVAASTLSPEVRDAVKGKSKIDASRTVGKLLAQRAQEKGVKQVKFDRGGYLYHGRVKAFAEGAREGGLSL